MRKLVVILSLVILGINADAKRISQDEATEIAADFFGESATSLRNQTLRQAPSKDNGYYIFTSRKNDAFVILSRDTKMPQILAYSRENGLDVDDIPPQLHEFLNTYTKIYDYVTEKGIDVSSYTNIKTIPIKYKTRNWGQTDPFNKLCPTVYTGCCATAMAIKMKYHNYPERGTGSHSYRTPSGQNLSMDFDFDLNFNLMNTDFSPGTYIENQANAVAKLMYACGVALDMNYGNQGSSASLSNFVVMARYFGYSNDIKYVRRRNVSDSKWIAILDNELDNNGPVVYSGTDKDNNKGHAFIIDGRNRMGMYHINWGWSGSGNGYFRIDILTPLERDYSYDHEMIINARPANSVGKVQQKIQFKPK